MRTDLSSMDQRGCVVENEMTLTSMESVRVPRLARQSEDESDREQSRSAIENTIPFCILPFRWCPSTFQRENCSTAVEDSA